ncbi:transglutaminase domain-containing protein [archaeon]|jgi:hypothetical protein|nr:transglutaminase domain-containing protein [archaeon]MBT4373548.1 transglutaminase domain-containing protein [archaeon]MBT4531996.1 transglutaminase domain-containing protein [archaeon]MBT7001663.1 transglutaminase domain-containing protein [archaeon]MBT7282445.1 transglutaminase domain-containing protein [archaeon]
MKEIRIKVFEKIRDIPYHISESVEDQGFRCWDKNRLLLNEFKKLGYEARLIVTKFSWDKQSLPKDLVLQAPANHDVHPFVEIKIKGEWIRVDATLDKGFSNFNKWDGETDTSISINYDLICTPEESMELNKKEDWSSKGEEWFVFGKKLNEFFKKIKN